MSKTKTVAVVASHEALEALRQMFPQDAGYSARIFPRLTFKSQNVTEGKGKAMQVVIEAGTFIEERETEVLNEDGKKIWSKEEKGTSINGIILYQRKQLRYYDEDTEEFTSSPIFDDETEIVPLFLNKREIKRGTPAELKAGYAYTDPKDGKIKSKLEENRILYILKDEEIFQLNLRGSSMYSFLGYARKTNVPSVVTTMDSEFKEKGTIEWNQMTFTPARSITTDEAVIVLQTMRDIKESIAAQRAAYPTASAAQTQTPVITTMLNGEQEVWK